MKTKNFVHIQEPYGRIELAHAKLVPCKNGLKVVGIVVNAPWNGALLCGVPVGKSRQYLPAGSRYEVNIHSEYEWKQGYRRDIAM